MVEWCRQAANLPRRKNVHVFSYAVVAVVVVTVVAVVVVVVDVVVAVGGGGGGVFIMLFLVLLWWLLLSLLLLLFLVLLLLLLLLSLLCENTMAGGFPLLCKGIEAHHFDVANVVLRQVKVFNVGGLKGVRGELEEGVFYWRVYLRVCGNECVRGGDGGC